MNGTNGEGYKYYFGMSVFAEMFYKYWKGSMDFPNIWSLEDTIRKYNGMYKLVLFSPT